MMMSWAEKCMVYLVCLSVLYPRLAVAVAPSGSSYRNSAYVEVLGMGGYGSVNYERRFSLSARLDIPVRIGLSSYRFTDFTRRFNPDIILPFSIGLLTKGRHGFEVAVGQAYASMVSFNAEAFEPERNGQWSGTATLGYRLQVWHSRMFLRAAYTPVWVYYQELSHWGGITIGLNF